jgi:hypothetical protein
VAGGEHSVQSALAAYLRRLETEGGTSGAANRAVEAASSRMTEAIANGSNGGSGGSLASQSEAAGAQLAALAEAIARHDAPATPDGCFPALFGK